MDRKFTEEDDALLAELGVDIEPRKATARTPREERIIAGFEDIQRFVERNDRAPCHGPDADIFERLYAVRLDRIREQEDCRALLTPFDHQALLNGKSETETSTMDDLDDDALLAELGVEGGEADVTRLRHVRPSAEKRAAEEVATRRECPDFDSFRPVFEQVQRELDAGIREARRFRDEASIEPGQLFILGGQKILVAGKGEEFRNAQNRRDARLRVIFDNGTENNMLRRSLERALQKDETGRRIPDSWAGPLFADRSTDGDQATGTIYVLRSHANIPFVAENRELVHKIGVTTSKVESRIAGARLDPTYLMADVEVVASYQLYNVDRGKLERLIHRIFDAVRLDVEIEDRFGNPVVPREWFLVPLPAIDDAVDKIVDGTIMEYTYDAQSATLVKQ